MVDIVSITLPIFLLILLGFSAARLGLVEAEFVRGLGGFVLNFALPALIFHAFVAQDLRHGLDARFLAVYGGASLVVLTGVFTILRIWLRRETSHAAIAALGSATSNSGFIGFPVVTMALGGPALIAVPMAMLVENLLAIPLALILAEAGSREGRSFAALAGATLARVARMPLIIAILAGLLASLAGFRPPAMLGTAIEMMADASAASALFAVGGMLATIRTTRIAGDVTLIVAAKLVVHPLSVAAGFWMIGGVAPPLIAAGLLLAGAPMITVFPLFGQRYRLGEISSVALLVATGASFVTLTALIGLVLESGLTGP